MREKIHSYLGFAKKSRALLCGTNSTTDGIRRNKVKLLLIASDIAENSKEKIIREAERKSISYEIYGTVDKLSEMTGESARGIYGVTDTSLAEAIKNEIKSDR